MKEAKLLTDYQEWDKFVEESLQGTIFSTTKWMKLFDNPFKILGYFREGKLVGGMAFFEVNGECHSGWVLTPFQGILTNQINSDKITTKESFENEVATALSQNLGAYKVVEIYNHYTFSDMRPFLWQGFKPIIKYTYVVKPNGENLERQTRYEIGKAQRDNVVIERGDIERFDKLYTETFERKGMSRPVSSIFIQRFNKELKPDVFIATKDGRDIASAVIIYDTKRAYYILGASNEGHVSSLTLWEALPKNMETDLVGCNDQKIALFKRGFGGKLMPYYGVRKNV